jgi:hypothetical protein
MKVDEASNLSLQDVNGKMVMGQWTSGKRPQLRPADAGFGRKTVEPEANEIGWKNERFVDRGRRVYLLMLLAPRARAASPCPKTAALSA